MTIIFSALMQAFLLILDNGKKLFFPSDYFIIYSILLFDVIEVILAAFVVFKISVKQTEMYYLRNSQITSPNKVHRIKTSKEIEEELFIHFPNLKNFNSMNDKKNN